MWDLDMADMTDRELLVKVVTQLDNLSDDVRENKSATASMQREVADKLDSLERKLVGRMETMEEKFVTKAEFEPYRRGLNIVAVLMLTAIVGAILAMVVSSGGTILP